MHPTSTFLLPLRPTRFIRWVLWYVEFSGLAVKENCTLDHCRQFDVFRVGLERSSNRILTATYFRNRAIDRLIDFQKWYFNGFPTVVPVHGSLNGDLRPHITAGVAWLNKDSPVNAVPHHEQSHLWNGPGRTITHRPIASRERQ